MMNTIITREKVNVDLSKEVSSYGVFVIGLTSALFGILGLVCLLSVLFREGQIAMIKGYITAITGI